MVSIFNSRAFEQPALSIARADGDIAQPRIEPRKYQYKTLMQVDVFNTYYNESDGKCTDLRIYPTASTQSLMKSLGLLFKERTTGFSILYNNKAEEGLIRYFRKHGTETKEGQTEYWSKLSFIAALDNPLFVNFTDLPFNVDLTARNIYLSNQMAHRDGDEVILNQDNYVSSQHSNFIEVVPTKYAVPFAVRVDRGIIVATKITVTGLSGEEVICIKKKPTVEVAYLDFTTVPEGQYTINWLKEKEVISRTPVIYTTAYPTPLCFIDLLFSRPTEDAPGIYPVKLDPDKGSITSVFYNLKFKARDIHWVYWVVSSSQPVENMRIKAEGASDVTFYGPTPGSIPTGETAWSFVSDQVIPMQQRSPLRFKLVDRLNCRCEASCECKNRMILNPLPLVSSNQVLSTPRIDIFPPNTGHDSEKKKYSEVYVYV